MPRKRVTGSRFHSRETEPFPDSSVQWKSLNLSEGEVLGGRFRVSKRLGKGSMGAVFKAWDKTLKKYVALKFRLTREQDSEEVDAERRKRFLNEVKKAQEISHPNICRIHDVSETDTHQFFSMEFIDGEDLEHKLLREGALEIDEALCLGQEICAGLEAIHSTGLFHQDLKPANVMIDSRGRAKITDFGLTDQHFQGWTRRYASPEQLIEQKVYLQSDLFALGLVLYECFTGRRAYFQDVIVDPAPESIQSLRPEVPMAIEAIIFRCLQKDPGLRPRSAAEVGRALERSTLETSRRGLWKGLALLVVLVGSLGLAWWKPGGNSKDRTSVVVTFDTESLGGDGTLPPWVRTEVTTGEVDWDRDGSRLVEVPAGIYRLGSEDIDADSRPIHEVRLSTFWISKVPVTHAQFEAFLESSIDESPPKYWKDLEFGKAWQPLVGSTWEMARKYCQWAGMDLPTEAQWEAAARGLPEQERYPYPWGTEPPSRSLAWFSDGVSNPTWPERVGSFPQGKGPFGALDQLGNVWEWCRDGWNPRAYSGRDGSEDPVEPFEGVEARVVRGGSYQARASDLHVSYRASLAWDRENEQTGFRCVYEPGRSRSEGETGASGSDAG